MQLTKHHGLGNDFLVALEEVNGPISAGPDLARRLCDRRRGLGADGLIVGARPVPGEADVDIDVVMLLWNADGSRAEMSGNGIRCLGQALALHREDERAHYRVRTDGGLRRLDVSQLPGEPSADVSVTMGPVATGPEVPDVAAKRLGDRRHATADTGNPHLVVLVDDLNEIDVVGDGAWFETQFPAGVNVEFVTLAPDADTLTLKVWERGAGVTEACGTGATAAAHLARSWGLVGDQVRVDMPGGSATVVLDGDEPVLIGPSVLIATVEVPDA
jgi:diaminopimelate epimerase